MIRVSGGRKVTIGNEETWGHFDIVDEMVIGDSVLMGQPAVTVPSMVAGFEEDAALTVDGEGSFTVRFAQREGDGALQRVALRGA